MRTHLRLWVTTAVAAGDGFQFGIEVGGLNDIAVNVASGSGIDNPIAQPYLDWMLVDQAYARPGYSLYGPNNQVMVDLKSRRRLADLDRTLILSINNTAAVAALSVAIFSRVLLALP
jgi:hypothetical protein